MPPDLLPDFSGITVLVVDDDAAALDALTLLLRACGAHVIPAESAVAALAHLDTAAKIDALISDLSMPEMDGIELIQRVRRHPSRYRLPAIALSGAGTTYMEARGFDMFVTKPVDVARLCAAISAVLGLRRGESPT